MFDTDQAKSQTSADEDEDASSTLTVRATKRPLEKPKKYGKLGHSKKEKMNMEMKMLQSLVDVVKQPEKVVDSFNDNEDAIFGHFIVSEMRKITDSNAKLLLKQTITIALFQARIVPISPYQVPQHYGAQSGSFSKHCFPQYPVQQNFPNSPVAHQQHKTPYINGNNMIRPPSHQNSQHGNTALRATT